MITYTKVSLAENTWYYIIKCKSGVYRIHNSQNKVKIKKLSSKARTSLKYLTKHEGRYQEPFLKKTIIAIFESSELKVIL